MKEVNFSEIKSVKDEPKIEKSDRTQEDAESRRIRELRYPCQDLEGKKHPETGVPYERKEITLPDGTRMERVFPVFESLYEGDLPPDLHKESDAKQFKHMNEQLRKDIESDPELRSKFTEKQLDQIRNGDKPEGCTWHHAEDPPGRMELVETEKHQGSGHTGGGTIWGGRESEGKS